MNKEEFNVLVTAIEKKSIKNQGTAETILSLRQKGYLKGELITKKGMQALEPYAAKRAVFLAAGFGSRMVPITLNTPKPLVRVYGKRIIETLIDAILAAGINEIWIVRGYLGEQFELLQKKYPMIRLIDNPDYDGTGTISSFYYAKDLLQDAYVLESDLVVNNPAVIHKYHYCSDFLGTKTSNTEDWYFKTENDGTICEIGVNGQGDNLYKLIGISFWNEEDGKKLREHLEEAYAKPEGMKLPMSYIPFRVYKDQYNVSIMPCMENDVVEIDSFAELQEYDEAYKTK